MQELGGTDSYTNAISDIYQDNFDEGIFTGKGIYDVKIFHKVLCNEIPENIVLSHDLLEGNYLRCGLATDILLLDDYPSKYNTYCLRQSRWIRGDFQISRWLKNRIITKNKTLKLNPLDSLSKFKIFDNLRRSLVPIFVIISLIYCLILKNNSIIKNIAIIALVAYSIPTILDILNYIIFKKGKDTRFIYARKNFISRINAIKASIVRTILDICFLPHKAYITLNSIVKTTYRMKISKKHLLEWLTAEEAEKQAKTDLISYYKFMWINVLIGVYFSLLGVFSKQLLEILIGIMWIIGPALAWRISKNIRKSSAIEKISKEDKEYLLEIGKRTWQYFKDNINKENNYLPPDNYQEGRAKKIARKNINNKYWAWNVSYNFSL